MKIGAWGASVALRNQVHCCGGGCMKRLEKCETVKMLLRGTLLVLAIWLSGAAWAAGAARPTSGEDRLFPSFAEDATIIPNQWWEGSFEFTSYEHVDVTALMATAVFKPVERLEVGGRVGFGSASADGNRADGSGATDLDVWGKYHLGAAGGRAEFAVGGLVTVPTGDETAGLGHDAFNFEGFGAVRYRLPEAILAGHVGLRMNGDGHGQLRELDGRNSALFGVGLIFPLSDRVGLVGEANVESERWEGQGSDFWLVGGVNWRPLNRGIVRAAVTAGAPAIRLTIGYAYTF
jgi:hypothetical protein